MITDEDIGVFLEHRGVKGMKWGVRKVSRSERVEGRKELKALGKNARSIIKSARKANTSAERKQAADRYKKEVLDKVRSKQFKKAYQDAHTLGKGEMVAHVLINGPLASVTIKQIKLKAQYGHTQEVATAKQVLEELRS